MDESLKRGFRSLVSAKVAMSVIGAATLPLVVRVLGPGRYGDYAFLMSTFSLLMLVVTPAVTEGVQKFVAEDRDRPEWRAHVVGFYLRLALVLAAVGSVALAALTWIGVVERFLDPRFTLFFYVLSAHVVFTQLKVFTRHTLLGLGLERFSEGFSVLVKLISRGVGLTLAFVGFGVVGFLAADLLAAAVFVLAGALVLRGQISLSGAVRTRPDVPVRELLSFNGLNVVTVLLMMSLLHVDVMMVRLIEGDAEAGYYKAALVIAEYVLLMSRSLQSLMLHSASRLWSQGRTGRIQSLASRLTRYVFLSTALLAVGIFVLADRVMPLYFGPEFTASVRPLAILLPGVVGFALARPIYGINKGSGRLGPLVYALGATAAINVVANAVLIPRYGLTGAAVATSVSYGLMFLFQAGCAAYLGYSPVEDARPLRLVATVVPTLVALVALDSVIASDYLALAVVPPAGFFLFTTLALATGAVGRAEFDEAVTVLPAQVHRRIPRLGVD